MFPDLQSWHDSHVCTSTAIMAYWLVVCAGPPGLPAGPPGLRRPFLAICFRTKRPMERAGM
eukprot:3100706-Karenia_brevis.AAC.1